MVAGVVDTRLLGGWRHVTDDVRRLERGLRALPGTCACGQGSAHLAGVCPCCRGHARPLDAGCTDCEALLASLRDNVGNLVDATLRYLPALDIIVSGREGIEPADLATLRWQILHTAAIFQKLFAAAGEFREGCRTSHLAVLKTIASELAAEAGKVDGMLDSTPTPQAQTRDLRAH